MSGNWPLVTLQDVTTILGDGLHGTPKYDAHGDYYFINGNNLSDGRIELANVLMTSALSNHVMAIPEPVPCIIEACGKFAGMINRYSSGTK